VNKENASKLWKMIQEAGDYLGASGTPYLTRLHTSYADYLTFIKNKLIKD